MNRSIFSEEQTDHTRHLEEMEMQLANVLAVPRYPNWLMELTVEVPSVRPMLEVRGQGLANELRYSIQETNPSQEQAQPVEHVCTYSFLEQQTLNRQVSCLTLSESYCGLTCFRRSERWERRIGGTRREIL